MKRIVVIALVITSFPSIAAEALLLFGGKGHDVFLGCLNCGKYEAASVCNKYGEHGSKYAAESIWNKHGEYGSKHSSLSPWSKYATAPPVIVDQEGGFYGYFTAAKHHPKRTAIEALAYFTDNVDIVVEDLEAASDAFCGR